MSVFSPAVDAALGEIQCLIVGAVEVALTTGYNIRLIDGAGTIKFPDGRVFTGQDPIYGTIAAVDRLSDGVGDEAPSLQMTLMPASDAAAADLAAAEHQGSQVTFWLVVVDQATGAVIGNPDDQMLFLGLLDVPTLKKTSEGRVIEYDITSVFEDFLINDDGARLCDSFHRTIWPDDKGLEYTTSVPRQLNWGTNATHDGVDKSPKLGVTR